MNIPHVSLWIHTLASLVCPLSGEDMRFCTVAHLPAGSFRG